MSAYSKENRCSVRFTSTVYSEQVSTSKLSQENDPKHCSPYAQIFYAENGINWWRTPPESPDLYPIEKCLA